MKSVTRNLVEYTYDNQCLPLESCSFKQFSMDTIVTIPDCKPDVEQILKIATDVKINYNKIIKTPTGQSLEGMVLTGRKVIVEGTVNQKVQYIACEDVQSIHVVTFSTPFMTYVVLPADYNCCSELVVSGFTEDVTAELESCRQIYINNTLLVSVEVC